MTLNVEATYENGVLRPQQPVAFPEGTKVRLSIDVPDRDPMAGVLGIGDGPEQGDAADRHDDYL